MQASSTEVIIEVLDIEADPAPQTSITPKSLRIRARTATGQLDVHISQAAAAELAAALARHLQAGGFP
jgi:hypothetical protein